MPRLISSFGTFSFLVRHILISRAASQQSFADERCKGLGVVYQACSFLYLGAHTSIFYLLDGEVYHKLNASVKGRGGRAAYLQENLHRAQKVQWRQFRYIRFLKTDWRKRLRLPVLPYPKPHCPVS